MEEKIAYTSQVMLGEVSKHHFLMLAEAVFTKLNWQVTGIGNDRLDGLVNNDGQIKIQFIANMAVISGENDLTEKNKINVEQFISTYDEVKTTISGAVLEERYQAYLTAANQAQQAGEQSLQTPPENPTEQRSFWQLIMPRKDFTVTPALVFINALVFILMVIGGANIMLPSSDILIQWGANVKVYTLDGQWWRLLTCCFLHIGILHLALNMYSLLLIGLFLEPRMGSFKFAVAYLLTGIFASLTSVWWHDNTASAGASGAIFGLFGVLFAILTTDVIPKAEREPMLKSISKLIIYNLAFGMLGTIDNSAHIGGLLSGIIIGYAFYPILKRPDKKNIEFGGTAAIAVTMLTLAIVAYQFIPRDVLTFNKNLEKFNKNEIAALKIVNEQKEGALQTTLFELTNLGIPKLEENLLLVEQNSKLKVPDKQHRYNEILIDYSKYRLSWFRLYYKSLNENTTGYNDSLAYYNSQIKAEVEKTKELK